MKIENFIENFAEQFDETDSSKITPNTVFKDLDEWSSLIALSVLAMIDEEYDIQLKGDDIVNAHTINDLFEIIISNK